MDASPYLQCVLYGTEYLYRYVQDELDELQAGVSLCDLVNIENVRSVIHFVGLLASYLTNLRFLKLKLLILYDHFKVCYSIAVFSWFISLSLKLRIRSWLCYKYNIFYDYAFPLRWTMSRTYGQIWNELLENQLLPRRYVGKSLFFLEDNFWNIILSFRYSYSCVIFHCRVLSFNNAITLFLA